MLLIWVLWIPFLVVMILELRFALRTRNCRTEIQGTVVGLVENWLFDGRDRSSFKPQITYTYAGQQYTATTFHNFNYTEYADRHTVSIYVDPDHPERFVTYLERERRSMYIRLPIAAAILIAVVLAVFCIRHMR